MPSRRRGELVASRDRHLNHAQLRLRRPTVVSQPHPQPRSVPRRGPAGDPRGDRTARPGVLRGQGQWLRGLDLRCVRRTRPARRRRPVLRRGGVRHRHHVERAAVAHRRRHRRPPGDTQPDGVVDRLLAHVLVAGRRDLGRRRRRPGRRAESASAARWSCSAPGVIRRPAGGSPPTWLGRCRGRPRGRRPRRTVRWPPGGRRSPAPSPDRCRAAGRARRPSPG